MTLEDERDRAYFERNHLVAALARLFPSGISRTNIPGWDPNWHGICYIDLPTGQISYHYHAREAYLFAHLPQYTKPWDGHDKADVHRRLNDLEHRLAADIASQHPQVPPGTAAEQTWPAVRSPSDAEYPFP